MPPLRALLPSCAFTTWAHAPLPHHPFFTPHPHSTLSRRTLNYVLKTGVFCGDPRVGEKRARRFCAAARLCHRSAVSNSSRQTAAVTGRRTFSFAHAGMYALLYAYPVVHLNYARLPAAKLWPHILFLRKHAPLPHLPRTYNARSFLDEYFVLHNLVVHVI